MPTDIRTIITKFVSDIRKLLGNSLSSVIIYGSYARGDYTEKSDVDVMILVTLSDVEIKKIMDSVCDCAFDYLMEYGVDISPIIKNVEHFECWADDLPFYRNVRDEGVMLGV